MTVENNSNLMVTIIKFLAKGSNRMKRLVVDMVFPMAKFLIEEHKQGRYSPDILVTEKMISSIGDIGYAVGAQVAFLNPGLLMHWDGTSHHYVPSFGAGGDLNMSYFQRIINYFISPHMFTILAPFMFSPIYEVRFFFSLSILSSNSTRLEMTQTFFGLEYAQPLPPNHFLVGPALPLTLKELPERIVNWVEEHKSKPIYYMCMGTVATFTAEMIKPLMEAFKGQDFSVIWSFPENQRDILEGINIPENVILEDFLPQVLLANQFLLLPKNN